MIGDLFVVDTVTAYHDCLPLIIINISNNSNSSNSSNNSNSNNNSSMTTYNDDQTTTLIRPDGCVGMMNVNIGSDDNDHFRCSNSSIIGSSSSSSSSSSSLSMITAATNTSPRITASSSTKQHPAVSFHLCPNGSTCCGGTIKDHQQESLIFPERIVQHRSYCITGNSHATDDDKDDDDDDYEDHSSGECCHDDGDSDDDRVPTGCGFGYYCANNSSSSSSSPNGDIYHINTDGIQRGPRRGLGRQNNMPSNKLHASNNSNNNIRTTHYYCQSTNVSDSTRPELLPRYQLCHVPNEVLMNVYGFPIISIHHHQQQQQHSNNTDNINTKIISKIRLNLSDDGSVHLDLDNHHHNHDAITASRRMIHIDGNDSGALGTLQSTSSSTAAAAAATTTHSSSSSTSTTVTSSLLPPHLAYLSTVGAIDSMEEHDLLRQSQIHRVVIVIHGSSRNADDYICCTNAAIPTQQHDTTTIALLAPWFMSPTDSPHVTFANPLSHHHPPLRWYDGDNNSPDDDNNSTSNNSTTIPHTWRYGANAINWNRSSSSSSSSSSSFESSSYAAIDRMVEYIVQNQHHRFPQLQQITIVGHSAGGQLTQRWALLSNSWVWNKTTSSSSSSSSSNWSSASLPTTNVSQAMSNNNNNRISIRVVVANPKSFCWLDGRRYNNRSNGTTILQLPSDEEISYCPGYNQWEWGLDNGSRLITPYRDAAIANLPGGISSMIARYATRDVIYLSGQYDILPNGNCEDQMQGQYRRMRSARFYHSLSTIYGHPIHHRYVIPGVHHDHCLMFQSPIGQEAIFGGGCVGGVI
jgi:pimeloyl-ACP methyl ester carboxylesterase